MSNLWRKIWRRPLTDAGHVYYVKLRTDHGTLYKLGFTTKYSVKERFAFAGLGDEKLIEKVLLFTYRDNAYPTEIKLHKHFNKKLAFGKYSKDPELPLFRRGQGELYKSDILGLDYELYTEETKIVRSETQESFGGCLMLMLILVGLVGVPLGGWGIPILIGAGFWYMIASLNETKTKLADAGHPLKPKHPLHIQQLIESLSNP